MSFLTCFWLFPQNEHFSRSPPSPMRATERISFAASDAGRATDAGGRAGRIDRTPSRRTGGTAIRRRVGPVR